MKDNKLNYYLDYHITSLPYTIYVGLHTIDSIPEFSTLIIPEEVRGVPIEARFVLYDSKGEIIEFSSQMVPGVPSVLTRVVNMIPLKMVQKLLSTLS